MTPETEVFLAKAHRDLREAQIVAAAGVIRVAARCAYYAAFHAAEALICEWTGKVPKTHGGVHAEFARLLKDKRDIARALSAFLTQAYKHKQISDYGPAESDEPQRQESIAAIPAAVAFVERVEALLSKEG